MMTQELMYSITYILVSTCFIYPPTEFINAGLTIQSLFASFLGSEQMSFTHYHMRRTAATLLIHCSLPLGFYGGMILFNTNEQYDFRLPWTLSTPWCIYFSVSIALLLAAVLVVMWWSRDGWLHHPMAQRLQKFAPPGSTWRAVASTVDVEFRRFDKFTTGPTPGRRVIVTDSWLLRTSAYDVDVARQQDAHLAVVGSDEHALSPDSASSVGVQYLNFDVCGVNVKSFRIRLNAAEYGDLKDKLRSPIMNIRNVIIRQSLSERFLDAFRQQVERNDVFQKPPDMVLESCVGCMQSTSSVKLVRRCTDNDAGVVCRSCQCRPMWCLDCMGRWFASRQDQTRPDTWMGSHCPCPTCRAPFCMLDVCRVVQ